MGIPGPAPLLDDRQKGLMGLASPRVIFSAAGVFSWSPLQGRLRDGSCASRTCSLDLKHNVLPYVVLGWGLIALRR